MILEMTIGAAGQTATFNSNAWAYVIGIVSGTGVISGKGSFTNVSGAGSYSVYSGKGSFSDITGVGSDASIKGTASNAGVISGQGGA